MCGRCHASPHSRRAFVRLCFALPSTFRPPRICIQIGGEAGRSVQRRGFKQIQSHTVVGRAAALCPLLSRIAFAATKSNQDWQKKVACTHCRAVHRACTLRYSRRGTTEDGRQAQSVKSVLPAGPPEPKTQTLAGTLLQQEAGTHTVSTAATRPQRDEPHATGVHPNVQVNGEGKPTPSRRTG